MIQRHDDVVHCIRLQTRNLVAQGAPRACAASFLVLKEFAGIPVFSQEFLDDFLGNPWESVGNEIFVTKKEFVAGRVSGNER